MQGLQSLSKRGRLLARLSIPRLVHETLIEQLTKNYSAIPNDTGEMAKSLIDTSNDVVTRARVKIIGRVYARYYAIPIERAAITTTVVQKLATAAKLRGF